MKSLLFFSTADTDLLAIRKAATALAGDYGPIDARNPVRVDAQSFEALAASVAAGECWAVCLRLLGGRKAMPEGFDLLRRAAAESGTPFLAWPGERGADFELEAASTCSPQLHALTGEYVNQGGIENVEGLLRYLSDGIRSTSYGSAPPHEVPQHGIYVPGETQALTVAEWQARRRTKRPVVAIAFYRAHWMSGNLEFMEELYREIGRAHV